MRKTHLIVLCLAVPVILGVAFFVAMACPLTPLATLTDPTTPASRAFYKVEVTIP
ncbi:MAG: hypothetical protein RLZZ214_689 [Verrucomicrobiota bacterium]|jgi:hypothetical protein